ncbi:exonuclease domain-containing protein [Spirosoma soli]|uniref:Exonuclease domain-containing protein n=1 Tax=Spirosoma soli TaxID=1770529 RepID=A0ABW5LZA0_9BACT
MTYLIVDTETNGLPQLYELSYTDTSNWPRLISVSWGLYDETGHELSSDSCIVQPDGYRWNREAQRVHGIRPEEAQAYGLPLTRVLTQLSAVIEHANSWAGHFIELDYNVIGAEFVRAGRQAEFLAKPTVCTMEASRLISKTGDWLKLDELYALLFNKPMRGLHNAQADRLATAQCFFELKKRGVL